MASQKITHQDLKDSIDYIKEYMQAGFETMNARFDQLEARFDRLDKKGDRRFVKQTAKNRDFSNRTTRLEHFAGRVSRQTGISY